MDKQQAQNNIEETFESSFDKNGFTGFIKNLLNKIDDAPFTYQGNYIPDAYKPYIKTLERIGKFSDGGNNIDILVITLQKETSLERARTMQRNFIAWYLNGSRGGEMKDAALAAFVSPDAADWRFSLVKMDYKFEKTKTGKMKVKEEFTPARRWSFLVGTSEKSHTAQSRLVKILADDEHGPTLKEIEKVFDIETVTKEFFLKYRGLFLRTKEALDQVVENNVKVKDDFEAKGVDTVNFAKKLLGQIIFLYFLQKKGWFGVGRDDDWGTGSKNFLRELFDKKHLSAGALAQAGGDYLPASQSNAPRQAGNNFFNDILEPLFYEALRVDRSHVDGYYSRFDCKIPFLNGGLFDPIGNYDWVHTDINIPDSLFSNNVKTKEGDTGTGILDVFDRYNFTVKEDEPLEKEVAIDPELLGKAYEKFNAIRPDNYDEFKKALKSGKTGEENKFNKKFGVYYTPREIVHYMCQQSLISYLYSELSSKPSSYEKLGDPQLDVFGNKGKIGQLDLTIKHKSAPAISKEDIETLVQLGEQVSENEATALIKEQKIAEGKQKTTKNKPILSESIRKNAKLIDTKLAEITVCDPAVGSGAFPVGMMSEIVKARDVLTPFLSLRGAQTTRQSQFDNNRTVYNFKRQCIEHSLYGVDIDPGAVEIAKLRLWLSLVVDEEDIKNIKPLPNLDYRIMQGNSLISEFMGVSFDSDQEKNSENLMFKDEADELIEHFQQKKDEFLNESNVTRKSKLKEEVEDLLVIIFETKLRAQKADYFNRLKDIENKYSVVRNEKQRDELIKEEKERLYKESGFDLESVEKQLKEFTSGKKIKPFFLWNLYFSEVFHHKDGFDVVIANPPYINVNEMKKNAYVFRKQFSTAYGSYDIYVLFFEQSIQVLRANGILTFITSNKYFISDYAKRLRSLILSNTVILKLLDLADCKKVFEALVSPAVSILRKQKMGSYELNIAILKDDDIHKLYNINFSKINVQQLSENLEGAFNIHIDSSNRKIIKKLLNSSEKLKDLANVRTGVMGFDYWNMEPFIRDVKQNNQSIRILTNSHLERYRFLFGKNINLYKKTYRNPYVDMKNALLNETTKEFFLSKKIIVRGVAKRLTAQIDKYGYAALVAVHGIYNYNKNIKKEYVLALLNSVLFNYLHLTTFYTARIPKGSLKYPISFLKNLPIKKISESEQKCFVELVNCILSITKVEDYLQNPQKQAKVKALEEEIDQLVYKLYDLTEEEIDIVEGRSKTRGTS
ncbi:MAG: Eco57I restriction-modification methylase domain-containing protein [candidate division Zixibacteria bacterium]|nr:Eco57I restriction-modification methylase domain-containing protein [candidate division Zixibacteria bacterium]